MWRKWTMRPEKIHFPFPSPGTLQEWGCFFLLLSIRTLKEGVYGKKKKKSISLLHWARSGKREMYFFLGTLSVFSIRWYVKSIFTKSNFWTLGSNSLHGRARPAGRPWPSGARGPRAFDFVLRETRKRAQMLLFEEIFQIFLVFYNHFPCRIVCRLSYTYVLMGIFALCMGLKSCCNRDLD